MSLEKNALQFHKKFIIQNGIILLQLWLYFIIIVN